MDSGEDTNKQALQMLLWMAGTEPLPGGQNCLPYAAVDAQTLEDYKLAADIASIWSTSLPIQNKHTAQQNALAAAGIATGSIRSNTVLEAATQILMDATGEGGPEQARNKIYGRATEIEKNVVACRTILTQMDITKTSDGTRRPKGKEAFDGRAMQNLELASQIACIWCRRDADSAERTRDALNKKGIVDQARRDIIISAAEEISAGAMRINRGNAEAAVASIQARMQQITIQNIAAASGVKR